MTVAPAPSTIHNLYPHNIPLAYFPQVRKFFMIFFLLIYFFEFDFCWFLGFCRLIDQSLHRKKNLTQITRLRKKFLWIIFRGFFILCTFENFKISLNFTARNAATAADATDDGRSSTNARHDAHGRPATTAHPRPTPDATDATCSKFKHSTRPVRRLSSPVIAIIV